MLAYSALSPYLNALPFEQWCNAHSSAEYLPLSPKLMTVKQFVVVPVLTAMLILFVLWHLCSRVVWLFAIKEFPRKAKELTGFYKAANVGDLQSINLHAARYPRDEADGLLSLVYRFTAYPHHLVEKLAAVGGGGCSRNFFGRGFGWVR